MTPTIKVTRMRDASAAIKQAFKVLETEDVLVGIPEDKAARQPDADGPAPIGNAAIGYVQENGSPANNIPARAFLRPGVEDVRTDAVELLRAAAREALRGNPGGVRSNFNKLGLLAVNAVRARFVNNDWPALADATLAARARIGGKGPAKKRGQPRATPRRANPLIVTGQLRRAITYVIRGRR